MTEPTNYVYFNGVPYAPVPKLLHPTMQQLLDAGINGFALELLSESLAGKKDIKTFKPIRFLFRGVIYTLEPEIPANESGMGEGAPGG